MASSRNGFSHPSFPLTIVYPWLYQWYLDKLDQLRNAAPRPFLTNDLILLGLSTYE